MEIQGKLTQAPPRSYSLYRKMAWGTLSIATVVIVVFTIFKRTNLNTKTSDQLLSAVSVPSLIAYLDNAQLDEEDLFNELETDYVLSGNVLSNNIEQATLKNYEATYSTEDELDLYDYE